ncbi:MAG: putative 2OG-Fe(II) oxygenase [Pseudomonadota bacterium]
MSKPASDGQSAEVEAMIRSANAKRKAGNAIDSAREFDSVLARAPNHPSALHGRARLALARGESDALKWFDKALKADPGNADLWLGKAQALDVAGDAAGAMIIARQICEQAPGFIVGLEFLAGLRLAQGDADFAQDFYLAAKRVPQDPNIPAAHADILAGLAQTAAAAKIAQEARKRFPNETHFALLEAANASASGQLDRADTIFEGLSDERPSRLLQEARHQVRAQRYEKAENLLEKVLSKDPWNIAAWALFGVVWRVIGDERSDWLHEQKGLVQMRPLEGRAELIDDATQTLKKLHENSVMPLNQSLRGGTQTRGVLFHRHEPVLAELHTAIQVTLESYRRELPDEDKTHPLLRLTQAQWALAGSWSVRLVGGRTGTPKPLDHHAAHIHPAGIVSSALYCAVPDAATCEKTRQGWLELGRPPTDLAVDLDPICVLKPVKGHLALFPSTLYHGTTPFASTAQEERITTAFDVVALNSR